MRQPPRRSPPPPGRARPRSPRRRCPTRPWHPPATAGAATARTGRDAARKAPTGSRSPVPRATAAAAIVPADFANRPAQTHRKSVPGSPAAAALAFRRGLLLRLSICRVTAVVGACRACPMSPCRMMPRGFALRTRGCGYSWWRETRRSRGCGRNGTPTGS